jgi:hypothetical protein
MGNAKSKDIDDLLQGQIYYSEKEQRLINGYFHVSDKKIKKVCAFFLHTEVVLRVTAEELAIASHW